MTTGDAGLRDIARALAEELRSSAEEGWAGAALQVEVSGGVIVSVNGWTDVEPDTEVDLLPLAEALRTLPGTVEVPDRPSRTSN
jgi:hypothetical protein